jgi:hypothetical protein
MGKPPVLDDINLLYTTLENAHKAGDVEAARELTQYILKQEDMAKDPDRLPMSEKLSPELMAAKGAATGAGLKTLQLIPAGISKAGHLFLNGVQEQAYKDIQKMLASGMTPDAVEKWYYNSSNYKKFGIPYQEAINYKHAHALAQPKVNAFLATEKLKPLNDLFPTLPPTVPTTGAPPSAPPVTKPSMAKNIMSGLQKVGSAVAPYASAAGNFLNPVASMAGAGYAGADAYNRHQVGDTTGRNIAAVGALGSLASAAPHPLVKGIGAGVGLGAEAINNYRDKLRRGEIVHGGPEYENVDALGNPYATGGLVHLKKKK